MTDESDQTPDPDLPKPNPIERLESELRPSQKAIDLAREAEKREEEEKRG